MDDNILLPSPRFWKELDWGLAIVDGQFFSVDENQRLIPLRISKGSALVFGRRWTEGGEPTAAWWVIPSRQSIAEMEAAERDREKPLQRERLAGEIQEEERKASAIEANAAKD